MTDEPPAVEAGRPLGLTARQAALVAWSGAWVTGILWLWLEPSHPFVRHHAAHAAVLMGGLMALALGLWVSCLLAAFVSPSLFRLLAWTATLAWGLFLCGWIYGLIGPGAAAGCGCRGSPAGRPAGRRVAARANGRGGALTADQSSPFQSSGSAAPVRKISRCHLPPPQGSMTSVATTSTRISANVAAFRDRPRGDRPARPTRRSGRAPSSGTDRTRRRRR